MAKQKERPDKPPVGKPFTWENGPLTGNRIKVKTNWIVGRRWSPWDETWGVCEVDLIPKLTGTIGPLCTLGEANKCLYPLVPPAGLRTNCNTEEFETGQQYLVIWDRRPDEPYPVIDSYYEGELREYTKPICKVDSWKTLREEYHKKK